MGCLISKPCKCCQCLKKFCQCLKNCLKCGKSTNQGTPAPPRVTSPKPSQPAVETRTRSAPRSKIKSEGNAVSSAEHSGGSDCRIPTVKLTRPLWPGEEASRERPRQAVTPPTPPKKDIKSMGNGHGGGNDRCSKPTRADMPVARRRSITRTS